MLTLLHLSFLCLLNTHFVLNAMLGAINIPGKDKVSVLTSKTVTDVCECPKRTENKARRERGVACGAETSRGASLRRGV